MTKKNFDFYIKQIKSKFETRNNWLMSREEKQEYFIRENISKD